MCIFILLIYTSYWKRPSISLGYFFYPSKGLSKDIIYQILNISAWFWFSFPILLTYSFILRWFMSWTIPGKNIDLTILNVFCSVNLIKKVTIFLQDNKKYLKSIWLIFSSTMCFTSYWIKRSCFGVFATTCVLCNITNGFITGFNK